MLKHFLLIVVHDQKISDVTSLGKGISGLGWMPILKEDYFID